MDQVFRKLQAEWLRALRPTQDSPPLPPLYTPLSSSEIRLITLVPDTSEPHRFTIKLQVFPFPPPSTPSTNDPPSPSSSSESESTYWALSYTWGHPTFHPAGDSLDPRPPETRTIRCNGHRIPIGLNLFNFLSNSIHMGRVRHERFEWQHDRPWTKWLWVDALCINQGDDAEKGRQVGMMAEIYKCASRVVVWLGDAEPGADIDWVFRWFYVDYLVDGRNCDALADESPLCTGPAALRIMAKEDRERWQRVFVKFFDYFCRCRWFSRGWVIQEAIFEYDRDRKERVSPLVVFGSEEVAMKDLEGLFRSLDKMRWSDGILDLLHQKRPDWRQGCNRVWPGHLLLGTKNILQEMASPMLRMVLEIERSMGVLDDDDDEILQTRDLRDDIWIKFLAAIASIRQTSPRFEDPRDHVYGFTGLYSATNNVPFPLATSYNMSTEDVYTAFTELMLRQAECLRVLGQAGLRPNIRTQTHAAGSTTAGTMVLDLPSWVPNYSQPVTPFSRPSSLGKHLSLSGDRRFRNRSGLTGPAAGVWEVHGGGGGGKKMLTLFGSKLNSVSKVFTRFDGIRPLDPEGFLSLATANEQRDAHLDLGGPFELIDLLTADDGVYLYESESGRDDATLCAVLQSMLAQDLPDVYRTVQKALNARRQPPGPSRLEMQAEAKFNKSKHSAALQRIGLMTQGRRIFKTCDGKWGTGPEVMETGDEIYWCNTGLVPLVLRKRSQGGFQLVGEAYLSASDDDAPDLKEADCQRLEIH